MHTGMAGCRGDLSSLCPGSSPLPHLDAPCLKVHGDVTVPVWQAALDSAAGAAQEALCLAQLPEGHHDAPHQRGQRHAQHAVRPGEEAEHQQQLGLGFGHACTARQREEGEVRLGRQQHQRRRRRPP